MRSVPDGGKLTKIDDGHRTCRLKSNDVVLLFIYLY